MLGSTYGLNAPSQPSGNSLVASDGAGCGGAPPCPDGSGRQGFHYAFGDDGRAFRRVEPVQHAPVPIPDGDDCVGLAGNLNRDRRNVLPRTIDCACHPVGLVRPFDGERCHCLFRCTAFAQAHSGPAHNGMAHSPIDEVKKAFRIAIPQVGRPYQEQMDSPKVPATAQERTRFALHRPRRLVSAAPVCFHGDSAGAEVKLQRAAS